MPHTACLIIWALAAAIHTELFHSVRLPLFNPPHLPRYFINLCQEIHSRPAGCPSGATVCRTLTTGKTEVLGRVYTQEMKHIGGSRHSAERLK